MTAPTEEERKLDEQLDELAAGARDRILEIVRPGYKPSPCARYGTHLPHPNGTGRDCVRCGKSLSSEIPKSADG